MTTPASTTKRTVATAVVALLAAFTMGACAPIDLTVEKNMAKSFARKIDGARDLRSSCSIEGGDSTTGSRLSECSVFGSNDYYLIVRVSTDYKAGTFSVYDPYTRGLGGYLKEVDGVWTYGWGA